MAIVSAGYLSGAEFRQAISTLATGPTYMMLERPDTSRFENFDSDTDWTSWDRGRVFGAELDLQWQKDKDLFHVAVITNDRISSFTPVQTLNLTEHYRTRNTRWLLWGRKEAGDKWIERRIPKFFDYPLEAGRGSRVALTLTEYQNNVTGQVEFYRFTGLEEVSSD